MARTVEELFMSAPRGAAETAGKTDPEYAERCLIVVGMTYDGRMIEHRVMADMGLDAAWHPTDEDMQAITFAAKLAALKRYRLGRRAKRAP